MSQPPPIDLRFLRSGAALKRVAAVTVALSIAGVAYASLAPKWYDSTLTVVPAKQPKSGLSTVLGGDLSGLSAGFDGGGGADVARIAAVLEGTTVSDAVIEQFRLRERYGVRFQEQARRALWSHCAVKSLPKPGLVQLTCEDKDPRFVQELLAYFADVGNQVFRRVGVSSATEEVRFLEKRVAELREQTDASAARMRQFEEAHQIIDLDSQSKAVVSALASLHGQRISKQLELDYAKTFSSGDEATMRQLRSQLAVMDDQVRDLEQREPATAPRGRSRDRGMFPSALSVPKLRAEFEKLYRDRKVSEATLVFALERLEAARASEARDVSTFVVLDAPPLPTRHARPKRLLFLVVFGGLGAGAGAAAEGWRARRRADDGEAYRREAA